MKNQDLGQIAMAAAAIYAISVLSKAFKGSKPPEIDIPGGGALSKDEAKILGQRAYVAMRGWGTNENTLFSIFEGRSPQELIDIFNAYSVPKYPNQYYGQPLDLFGWFRKELGKKDLARMQLIWDKTGKTI